MEIQSANFGFLRQHDLALVQIATHAERYFHDDSNTCIIKLRQYAERLAKLIAANTGLYQAPDEAQAELLKRLKLEGILPSEVADLFHSIRISGNRAVHNFRNTDRQEALTLIKNARHLGIWFHRTFKDKNFKAGAFIPPALPIEATADLQAEIARLQEIVTATQSAAERSRLEAEQKAIALMSAEEKARQALAEKQLWEQMAIETEQKLSQQITNHAVTPKQTAEIIKRSEIAAQNIDLDEDQTRQIIDQKLRDRGWEVDSQNLRYSQGIRPTKGKNIAISEYPTSDGIADYALFIGLRCVAMIEAKRRRKNVMNAIAQAERYAKGYRPHPPAPSPKGRGGANSGSPRPEGEGLGVRAEVQVPFVFATNGRGYLKQLETESGIWFRDIRKSTNHSRALIDFYTPDGLEALLTMDRETAHEKFKNTSFNFGFNLYPHQRAAIEKIEECLEQDQRSMLVAMATGTGKTKLAIALLYRLLSTKRFRRVCFVVDRSALGNQTADEFNTTKVVTTKTFTDIFGLKGLKDIDPESETKVHICTIQGLVKRVLYAKENGDIPPIDQYDLILIDECHRGYLLDREMSDAELSFRNQDDYISKYRRVLEHFDAVKIGLTATPALHTKEIFGEPIYKYSYRDAVMFNKKVITVPFNRAIAQELAVRIDPMLDEKTLIFAANDSHADTIVTELKRAMQQRYEEMDNDAIQKITGAPELADRISTLIRSFRNDSLPKIAVTVDLLTTGIDVPKICNLVFVRRVNSRILYAQMLGRATRRCDEIGKETFKIWLNRCFGEVKERKKLVIL